MIENFPPLAAGITATVLWVAAVYKTWIAPRTRKDQNR